MRCYNLTTVWRGAYWRLHKNINSSCHNTSIVLYGLFDYHFFLHRNNYQSVESQWTVSGQSVDSQWTVNGKSMVSQWSVDKYKCLCKAINVKCNDGNITLIQTLLMTFYSNCVIIIFPLVIMQLQWKRSSWFKCIDLQLRRKKHQSKEALHYVIRGVIPNKVFLWNLVDHENESVVNHQRHSNQLQRFA
jgi:hypothetical protein